MKKPYCNQCGDCCRGFSDDMGIEIRPIDAKRIAKFLKLKVKKFLKKYTYIEYLDEEETQPIHYLYDKSGSCLFLSKKNRCKINPVKPVQCAVGWPDKQFLQYLNPQQHYPCVADEEETCIVYQLDS